MVLWPGLKENSMADASTDRVRPKQISDNDSVNKFVDNYLWIGETVMDQSVAFMSSSKYFERRR